MKRGLKVTFGFLSAVLLNLASTAAWADPIVVNVSAKPEWTQTSFYVNSGDSISVSAIGSWRHDTCCGSFYGPNGDPNDVLLSGGNWQDSYWAFMRTARHGALIGAIAAAGQNDNYFFGLGQNNPAFFLVGANLPTYTASVAGFLYLGFNDWGFAGNPPAISDNAGSVTATIDAAIPVPEPASLALLGLGLAGLGFARRSKA